MGQGQGLIVFPFTVPLDGRGNMLDAAQGVYGRSLARMLAERLSDHPHLRASLATLTADGPLDGQEGNGHGWVVASQPWNVEEACCIGLPEGTQYVLHGAAELTDRVRIRILLVDQPNRKLALDHVVLRPRGELFAALDEAAVEVARALGEPPLPSAWPTRDVEAFLAYLRGRDLTAAHEAGVQVPDPAKSFDPYLEALRRDPQFAEAQERLLSLALDFALGGRGPVEAARTACERVLLLDEAAYRAHAALAEIELARGDPRKAEEHLGAALGLKPDWTPAYERLGTALVQQQSYAAALPWFEKALGENPNDADALLGIGVALAEGGRLEEAISAWRLAVACGVHSAQLQENLARAFGGLGRNREAREHRREARRLRGTPRFGLDLLREAWQWLRRG